MGAEGDTTTDVFGFTWYAELTPSSTGSEDDLIRGDELAEVSLDFLLITGEGDAFDLTIVQQVDGIGLCVLAQVAR